MDPKIIITFGLTILVVLLAIATVAVAGRKTPDNQMVYILGLLTAVAIGGVIVGGIAIHIWLVWVPSIFFLLAWLLYLAIYQSVHHEERRRRTH